MITAIIILLISETLFRFMDSEMDTIKFRPNESWFPSWNWYTGNAWKDRNWFIKVPFSMFLDGWHFVKFLAQMSRIISPVLIVTILLGLPLWYIPIAVVVLYGFGGLIWELSYA